MEQVNTKVAEFLRENEQREKVKREKTLEFIRGNLQKEKVLEFFRESSRREKVQLEELLEFLKTLIEKTAH